MDYKFLSRKCHKESSTTSCCRIFNSFYYGNQSIWNTNLQGQPNKPKHNPKYFTHFKLAPNNLIMLTWHNNQQQSPYLVNFTLSPQPLCLSLPKIQQRLYTAALPSHTTLLSLSQHFHYSPSNSFLQFQLVSCCYVNDG